ncbi:hypothetical protein [Streptomyces rapamycinicus]|uniref:Uncharacterized protein n=1 Tax=Streptomyces rapamycinicus TaxID=1226757 RepID=A0ABR6LTZ6_9ACTN|nr:hypothetical protein [Streptomyces rapamycinicus]MBB4785802.1 hypothetical protein [Streptomyces rapamycinicus]UTO65955.1 hypothetical protein LJB45_28950 [Streptomyces rapamycinicus]UTP33910.1 hypothetical protein LIV37_34080 [Streptomyces rapamycinicus NRRL 5491]
MQTNAACCLPWTPPNTEDVEALPAGRWWDAVRAAPTVGERALELLGDATGAVIKDKNGTLYWLVAVGTETSWHLRQVRVLTELADESTYLGVPPVSWTEGPRTHWRVPLSADHYLTDAGRLWGALAEADRAEYGRRPEGRQLCYRCKLPTDEAIPVDVEDSGGAVDRTTYACPAHSPLYSKRRPRTLTSAAAAEHEGRPR